MSAKNISTFVLLVLLAFAISATGCQKRPVEIGDAELERPDVSRDELLMTAYKYYLRGENKKAISCLQWLAENPFTYDLPPFPEKLDRDLKRISQLIEMLTGAAEEYSANEMHQEAKACYQLMLRLGKQMDTWKDKPPLFASSATFLQIKALDGLRGVATELFDDEEAEKFGKEINEILKTENASDSVIKNVNAMRKKLNFLNSHLYDYWKTNKTLPEKDDFYKWAKEALPDYMKASYDDFIEDVFAKNAVAVVANPDSISTEETAIKYIPVSAEKGIYRLYSIGPDGVDDQGLKEFNLYRNGEIYKNVNMPGDIVYKNPVEMKSGFLEILRDPKVSIYYQEELISEYIGLIKTIGDDETDEDKEWENKLGLIRKIKSSYMSAADIQSKLQNYYTAYGRYPDDIWELKNKMGFSIPNDQFSTKVRQIFRYKSLENGQWYRLWSYGPDGDNDQGEKRLVNSPESISDSDIVFDPLKIREGRR